MGDFNDNVGIRQTKWRQGNVSTDENGKQNDKIRTWILPEELWSEGLWEGIRESLPKYLDEKSVQKHIGCHNLKSSWMLCANLYFPFRDDLPLISSFFKKYVDEQIETVDCIELEYAEEGELSPSKLLGESNKGTRGANQTSPDIGFIVNDGKGLVLVESKYTETSFYECSGKINTPEKEKCSDIKSLLEDIENNCYQLNWEETGRSKRKYWDYLKISDKNKEILKKCPASAGGYQLFRQQALAEALVNKEYDFAVSCVAYDEHNTTLAKCLKSTGLSHFSDFGKLFDGKSQFSTFTHQQWVQWVRENGGSRWAEWLQYINERYGY